MFRSKKFRSLEVREKDDWVTPDLLSIIRSRDRAKESIVMEDNSVKTFEEFKTLRGKAKRAVIRAKHDFIQSKLENAKTDCKLNWSELNDLYPRKKSKNKDTVITIFNDNNTEVTTEELPDYVIELFTSIDSKLANVINLDNSEYVKGFKATDCSNIKSCFELVTRIELHDLIMKMMPPRAQLLKI